MSVWERLGSPRYVVAPMVDASELAWRMLCRRHGAQLCYTPMLHSSVFVKHPRYREVSLASCPEDRPLIIQFCGNDPAVMLEAAKLAEAHCDAIDINLGCPQAIAKRGRYGAFLQDDWELLSKIVQTLSQGVSVPITCKVRVFDSVEKSVLYAQMLETAGCKMLTVHGRTREQKGPLTGLASWAHIKAVRDNVRIPVIANGNIQCLADVERCLQEVGCEAVMTAEGNLHNPCLFEGRSPPVYEVAQEYLELVESYPCPTSYVRGHLFKLFHECLSLPSNSDLRNQLAKGPSISDFKAVVERLRAIYEPIHEGRQLWTHEYTSYDMELPPWICKPRVRMAPEEHIKKMEAVVSADAASVDEKENNMTTAVKRAKRESSSEANMSKKKLKKLQKRQSENPHCRKVFEKCCQCPNPVGLKCEFSMCKACCKTKCYLENWDCPGHRILTRTRRERARTRAAPQNPDPQSQLICR
uniref:tRNA-dihydrouridine(16/17) synthase [NAD(P)(+)] n=1 Tax=Homalodisca liturata TaxID=320908 RepID=A0A1B6I9I4_9HEMI